MSKFESIDDYIKRNENATHAECHRVSKRKNVFEYLWNTIVCYFGKSNNKKFDTSINDFIDGYQETAGDEQNRIYWGTHKAKEHLLKDFYKKQKADYENNINQEDEELW